MKIAAIVTCYTKNSHADVIVGKFLRGFPTDAGVMCVCYLCPCPPVTLYFWCTRYLLPATQCMLRLLALLPQRLSGCLTVTVHHCGCSLLQLLH